MRYIFQLRFICACINIVKTIYKQLPKVYLLFKLNLNITL